MKTPNIDIAFIGPEIVPVEGDMSKHDYMRVLHMTSRVVPAGKFFVCIGVFDPEDVNLYGEIIGPVVRRKKPVYHQPWTAITFERSAKGAQRRNENGINLMELDITILQGIFEEITTQWQEVKESERFDMACEMLRQIVSHVRLSRTEDRTDTRIILSPAIELTDSFVTKNGKRRVNPQANSKKLQAAIRRFVRQVEYDERSQQSLQNREKVAVLLNKQTAAQLEYLEWCVVNYQTPPPYFVSNLYKIMPMKPYSYAIDWVRARKAKGRISKKEEMRLLYQTLTNESRLALVDKFCAKLKRFSENRDITLERMVELSLVCPFRHREYKMLFDALKLKWIEYKRMADAKEYATAQTCLSEIQELIRNRASEDESHPWYVIVDEYIPFVPPELDDVFAGFPSN